MIITQLISDIATLPQRVHLALGVFDGVHLGHREVIQKAINEAQSNNELSGVVTFDPFPVQVVAPNRAPQKILANIAHKQQLLTEMGVDFLLVIPFDQQFSQNSAEQFLKLLTASGKVAHISVGEDWKFGKGREGRLEYLREYGDSQGILISATPPVQFDGERISSTRIRQAVRDGNLNSTERMLGRSYSLFGKVIKGQQLGRKIGFPTANVDVKNELLPPNGVYVASAEVAGELIHGVANLGVKPTVAGDGKRSLEVHLFDFSQEIYDLEIEVFLEKYLRPELKFDSVDHLIEQITNDCEVAKKEISQKCRN